MWREETYSALLVPPQVVSMVTFYRNGIIIDADREGVIILAAANIRKLLK